MSNQIARLYRENGKSRRRDSIFRPYSGDYLCEIDGSILEQVRDALFKIIDRYDQAENVLFADSTCGVVGSSSAKPGLAIISSALLVATNKAIYICAINNPSTNKSKGKFRSSEGGRKRVLQTEI